VFGPWGRIECPRVILATGGMALPRSGSDGVGYAFARGLGHTVTRHVFPALVPLKVEPGWFLTGLSGVAARATVEVRSGTGKRLESFTGSVLCTHFGLSGPAILDVSRYLIDALRGDTGAGPRINWLPGVTGDALDAALLKAGGEKVARLIGSMAPGAAPPTRLLEALLAHAGVDAASAAASLTREQRRKVVESFTALPIPVTGDRGFTFAEVTAGGVPLSEIRLETMESRPCPGLHLCGEILDVDGRIGGFNFQWAWASGFLAGRGAVGQESPERTLRE
jgi:predicted Rossmann fold flavoprotein